MLILSRVHVRIISFKNVGAMDIRNFFGRDQGKKSSSSKRNNPSNPSELETSAKNTSVKDKIVSHEQEQRLQVSAENFFANTGRSASSGSGVTKRKIEVTEEVEDEEDIYNYDEEEEEVSLPKKGQKTRAVLEDDDEVALVSKKDTSKDFSTVSSPIEDQLHTSTPLSTKKRKGTSGTKVSTAKKTKRTTTAKPKEPPPYPTSPLQQYDKEYFSTISHNNCLAGYTFVFTGLLPEVSREEAHDIVKNLGGRVTGSVSSKTNYVVCGDTLEDGRPVHTSQKYIKAQELPNVQIVNGLPWFFALIQLLLDRQQSPQPKSNILSSPSNPMTTPSPPHPPPPTIINPYAKKTLATASTTTTNIKSTSSSNVVNPYAKKKAEIKTEEKGGKQYNQVATTADTRSSAITGLWADTYAPTASKDILGNGDCVRKLQQWLQTWEKTFLHSNYDKAFNAPNGPWKAALLSGPPGIGKTTTATLVAKEAGRNVIELNASDVRSKKALHDSLGDITGSQVLCFQSSSTTTHRTKNKQQQQQHSKIKRCIIMDEVDGMGAGDRSGMSELIQMIKGSLVPIICICNDRQDPKIRTLASYCLDLKYRRPTKNMIARRAVEIGQKEGIGIEINAAEAIVESCGNDIRQVLNLLQMWSSNRSKGQQTNNNTSSTITYKEIKERQQEVIKDDILRLSIFDATKIIIEGPRNVIKNDWKSANESLYRRCDAFFMDYNIMGLNVHQNYLRVMGGQFQEIKRSYDSSLEISFLNRMYAATAAMSDFAVAELSVRGGDQNWGLLPFCSILAVKTGFHAGGNNGGFLSGFPEFSSWLGRNSSRGRMHRLLHELHHHMNYKISGDSRELRLHYLPVLKNHLFSLLTVNKDGPRSEEVIALMDEYGLDRDDLFENLDEFTLDSKSKKFSDLESKVKAAFTREYNKGVHKSQALVAEQGITKSRKRELAVEIEEAKDSDIVYDDEDVSAEIQDEDNNEMDTDKIKSMFQKKGRASSEANKQSKVATASRKSLGKKKR